MASHRTHVRNASWLVFAISLVVYWFSVERVGSLWDVGEFILGAHKLQVVHPPGAPLFLLIGRLFAWIGELISDDPSTIAWAVNFSSALCTSFAALFIAQVTGILGRYALVARGEHGAGVRDDSLDGGLRLKDAPAPTADAFRELTQGEGIALGFASLVAGLCTAFATSIWFSAVEGEVYAMSTLFTTMTFWAMVKWYDLPDTPKADRWIVFAVFATGLSVGVHLLSLLTFPALAIFYFSKKYPAGNPLATQVGGLLAWVIAVLSAVVALVAVTAPSIFNVVFFGASAAGFGYLGALAFRDPRERSFAIERSLGGLAAALGGVVVLVFAQAAVIKGIPAVWAQLEIFMVNRLGLPFHSGLIPLALVIGGLLYLGFRYARQNNSRAAELATMSAMMLVVGFSVVGVVMIRANASPPINMNAPTDAMRLQYYLNREQYGDRPLLYGPHFEARPTGYDYADTYGRVGDRYEVVDQKVAPIYRGADKMLFPRMADASQGRPDIYRQIWMDDPGGKITMGENLRFFVRYQLDWMYWRYFMWNFSGRQNHTQGFYPTDPMAGNWITGIDFVDELILRIDLDELPDEARDTQGRNTYFALPFLFGLLGLVFHLRRRPEDFLAVLALFVITGIGIILYTNQPPNEPRERDYVQAGAVFMYCVWIGMGVLALFELLRKRANLEGVAPAAIAGLVVLSAPALMGFEGFDDHSRMDHRASRDYAANFLNSLDENAIIFTYGDNDTYPLWYAQEVEGIRPDVRVINLSLIAVDWYIDLMRRKINESAPIKMTIPREAMRGELRNQILIRDPNDPRQGGVRPMSIREALNYVAQDHPVRLQGGQVLATDFPTDQVFIPVTPQAARASGVIDDLGDSARIERVNLNFGGSRSILKDDLAVMDIIGSNAWERPIYFAVTVPQAKMLGLRDYLRLEGLGLRLTPARFPSDRTFGPVGAGRVDVDRVYDNVTQKFAFGNFDKEDLFVDPSYAPSVQMTQFVLIRTISQLLVENDTARAGELARLYFEAFPHMNFPFDANTIFPIRILLETGQEELAKEQLRTLAESLGQWRRFYDRQNPAVVAQGGQLARESAQNEGTIRELNTRILPLINDPAFAAEMAGLLGMAPAVGTTPQELGQPVAPETVPVPVQDGSEVEE